MLVNHVFCLSYLENSLSVRRYSFCEPVSLFPLLLVVVSLFVFPSCDSGSVRAFPSLRSSIERLIIWLFSPYYSLGARRERSRTHTNPILGTTFRLCGLPCFSMTLHSRRFFGSSFEGTPPHSLFTTTGAPFANTEKGQQATPCYRNVL